MHGAYEPGPYGAYGPGACGHGACGHGACGHHGDPYMSEEEMMYQHMEHREEMLERFAEEGFRTPFDPPPRKNVHDKNVHDVHDHGFVHEVYGGQMSGELEEMRLVKAWRPGPGRMELATGVVHRIHYEDHTVTVQFVPDQHRARLPFSCVKLVEDITPTYPTIHLNQGEKPPSAAEMGPNGWQRPAGESAPPKNPTVQRWGLPAPTLDALRNRSIPASRITGVYGEHMYSNLYRHNFYKTGPQKVSASGHIGVDGDGEHGLSLHAHGQGAGAHGMHGGGLGGFGTGAGGPNGAGAGGLNGAGLGGLGGGLNGMGPDGLGGMGPGGLNGMAAGPGGMGPGGMGPGGMGPGGMGPGGMGPDGKPLAGGKVDANGLPVGWVGHNGKTGLGYDVGANGILSGADGNKNQLFDPSRGNSKVPGGGQVLSHHYIPLEGPELTQDLRTGKWYPLR